MFNCTATVGARTVLPSRRFSDGDDGMKARAAAPAAGGRRRTALRLLGRVLPVPASTLVARYEHDCAKVHMPAKWPIQTTADDRSTRQASLKQNIDIIARNDQSPGGELQAENLHHCRAINCCILVGDTILAPHCYLRCLMFTGL